MRVAGRADSGWGGWGWVVMRRFALGLSLVLSLAAFAACGGPEPVADAGAQCVPGETRACLCLGGAEGVQICRDNAAGYSECVGCGAESDLPTAFDLGGSACGDCEGCCDGTTCIPFATQTNDKCGSRNAACGACSGTKACAPGSGACVEAGGCGACAGGCCLNDFCLVDVATACGPACTACTYGVTCAAGSCTNQIDPAAQFRIRVKTVELGPQNPSGGNWDLPGAGTADPQVCVAFAQGGVFYQGCTDNCEDSLTCVFDDDNGVVRNSSGVAMLFPATVIQAGKLRIAAYDVDLSIEDPAGQGYFPATTDHEPTYQTGAFGSVINIVFELF